MASNFPTSLDDTTSLPTRSSGQVIPSTDSNDPKAAIIALETKLGIGASTPTVGKVMRGTGTGTTAWAQVDLTADVTGVLPVANFATGTPTGSKFVRDDGTLQPIPGGGDALVANPLSQFAATTSAQLAGVISDETGTGALVFGTSPTLTTPTIGSFANATHNHTNAAGGGTLTHSAISDFDTQVRTSTLNQMTAPSADLAMNSHKLTGLLDPTSAQDAATKSYVDAAAAGIDWKASVRAATTANGTLASAFANGSVIDGVTLATGNRILLKNQTTGSENGIYVVAASGAPTRSTDADVSAEVTPGMAVFVEEGTTNANTGWVMTNTGAVTLGTTALTFVQFTGLGEVTASTGLTKTGNTLSIDSTVATLTGTQALTNKDLTGAGNTFPTLNQDTTGKSAKTDALNSATTVVNVASATAPSSGQVLTATSSTAATWQTPAAGGGGQSIVTKVVAASGGDYTTLGAALAAASAGWVIALAPGTYTESAISSTLGSITIIGHGATLSMGTNNFTVSTGTGWRIEGVTFSSSTGAVSISNNTNCRFINNEIVSTGNAVHSINGTGLRFCNNRISLGSTDTVNVHLTLAGAGLVVEGNYFSDNPTITNGAIEINGTQSAVTGNTFIANASGTAMMLRLNGGYTAFTGNAMYDNGLGASCLRPEGGMQTISGNNIRTAGAKAICEQGGNSNVSSNHIRITNTAGVGIYSNGGGCTISGNKLFGATGGTSIGIETTNGVEVIVGNSTTNFVTGIKIDAGTNNVVVGNRNSGGTTGVSDAGTTTSTNNNVT